MAKYGLIIAAVCASFVMVSSCRLNVRVRNVVCMPSQAVVEKQLAGESAEAFGTDKRLAKTSREPLILLRILTEL
jgi:hypothetical protein